MARYLIAALGGAIGPMLRFWAGGHVSSQLGTRFPCGTFAIHITASFLIGFIMAVLAERAHLSPSIVIHRPHVFSLSHDVPVMVSVFDSEGKIQRLIPFLDEVVDEGLVAMSEAEVIKYVHQNAVRA